MRAVPLLVVAALLLLLASATTANPCARYLDIGVDCVDCVKRSPECFFCGSTCRWSQDPYFVPEDRRATVGVRGESDIARPPYDCGKEYFTTKNKCPERSCFLTSITLNERPCSGLYFVLFFSSLFLFAATLSCFGCLAPLHRSPWLFATYEHSEICPFTHQPTGGASICGRCGVGCSQLRYIGFNAYACVGCAALYIAQKLLALLLTVELLSFAVVFLELGLLTAFSLIAALWIMALIVFTSVAYRMYTVRRFLFVCSPSGYDAVGAQSSATLNEDQLSMFAAIPERHRAATLRTLREDEDVLWVQHRGSRGAVLSRDFHGQEQIAAFFKMGLGILCPGVLLALIVSDSAGSILLFFFVFAVFLAALSSPAMLAALGRSNASFVITNKRVLVVYPMLHWIMSDSVPFKALARVAVEAASQDAPTASIVLFRALQTDPLGAMYCVRDWQRALELIQTHAGFSSTVPAAAAASAGAESAAGASAVAAASRSGSGSDNDLSATPLVSRAAAAAAAAVSALANPPTVTLQALEDPPEGELAALRLRKRSAYRDCYIPLVVIVAMLVLTIFGFGLAFLVLLLGGGFIAMHTAVLIARYRRARHEVRIREARAVKILRRLPADSPQPQPVPVAVPVAVQAPAAAPAPAADSIADDDAL